MRTRLLGIRTVRALTSASLAAMTAGIPVASASAQSAGESLLRIRIEGSQTRRVGTVFRITPDSAFMRIRYEEHHGLQLGDVVFYGTQRLLADPPARIPEHDVLALLRTDVRSLERRGERRAWPFAVLGGVLFGVGGMAVYYGGVTPVTVPIHALVIVGGAALGRGIGRKIGQHEWHPVPRTDWDGLSPQ